MRFAIFTLALCSGTLALCQSPVPGPSKSVKPAQNNPAKTQEWLAQPRSDLNKLPPGWHVDLALPLKMTTQALSSKGAPWSQDSAPDSKMIVHPPQASLGLMQPGTPIEWNTYPGLKIMPIDTVGDRLEAKVEAIPVQWPNLEVQAIPSNWPKLMLNPVADSPLSSTQPPAK